jgi:hypothetical protein
MTDHVNEFYTYDPEDGFEIWATAAQAEEAAKALMDAYRDAAPTDGWHEDQEAVCWGELRQMGHAQIISRRPGEDGEEFDEYVEYDMRPTITGDHNA